MLFFREENRAAAHWGVPLEGGDDPRVVVLHELADRGARACSEQASADLLDALPGDWEFTVDL